MTSGSTQSVTHILLDWRSGKKDALEQLMPLVYDELRRLAGHYMKKERKDHTLQPTALVNEAYLRLVDVKISWQDRAHFFAVAARLMRRMLVDHARAQQRAKRGSDTVHLELAEAENVAPKRSFATSDKPSWDLVALDEAIVRLSTFDPRKSDIVVLHFFGGLNNDEVAEALGISRATVQRDLRLAKAWLKHELQAGP